MKKEKISKDYQNLGHALNTEKNKWCAKCESLKPRDSKHFYNNKGTNDKLSAYCKPCIKSNQKVKDYKNLGAEMNDSTNKWCAKCETLKPKDSKHFHRIKSKSDGFSGTCKICRNKARASYRSADYQKRKQDPIWIMRMNTSKAIRSALRKQNTTKNGSCFAYLPYTPEELRNHLESQFEDWMSWDNYGNTKGKWSIDHIVPQSLLPFDSCEHPNFLKCWSLSNLRPLDHIENIRKSNRLEDSEIIEESCLPAQEANGG